MMDEATRITDQGIAYYQQGNFDLAFQSFSQAAQMGNLLAMHNLAVCYSYGQGTQVDYVQAFRWMKAAADGGLIAAFYTLACKYYQGDGCERDLNQAAYWAQQATAFETQDSEKARQLLAQLQQEQAAPQIDQALELLQAGQHAEAAAIFRRLAEAGSAVAMNNLSVCYAKGEGVPQDRVEAFRWMKAAAENGCRNAFYPLANISISTVMEPAVI